jgi:hypothetical protein
MYSMVALSSRASSKDSVLRLGRVRIAMVRTMQVTSAGEVDGCSLAIVERRGRGGEQLS